MVPTHGHSTSQSAVQCGPGTEDRTACRVCHAVLWQLLRSRANGAASANAVAVSLDAGRSGIASSTDSDGSGVNTASPVAVAGNAVELAPATEGPAVGPAVCAMRCCGSCFAPSLAAVSTDIDGHGRKGIEPALC